MISMRVSGNHGGTTHATRPALGADLAAFLVGAATRAPSLHNSQPWQFVHQSTGEIELWADPERALPGTDPHGREMVIGCGAALATLALGVRWVGHRPVVTRLPEPTCPTLLARVALGPKQPAAQWEQDMFYAIVDRHTHRGPFTGAPVSPLLLRRLQRLAGRAGARAHLVQGAETLRRVARCTADADLLQQRQPGLREELGEWLRPARSSRRDGIIPVGVPPTGPGQLAARAFGAQPGPVPATAPASILKAGADKGAHTAHPPATVLLGTDHDDVLAWLSAGEALQTMLLHAAHHSVYASIHSQPLEVPSARARLSAVIGRQYPQMLLQLGHANGDPAAPRRAAAEVLTTG